MTPRPGAPARPPRSPFLPATRLTFAAFLDELAGGRATPDGWHAAIVQHYADDALEGVRRECVRALYDLADPLHPPPAEGRQLRAWAQALRESAAGAPAV